MRMLALLLVVVGCTWSQRVAALDSALFACDATQTYAASNGGAWDGDVREGDSLLGARPSGAEMYGTMAVNIAIAAAITAAPLPEWAKLATLGAIGLNVTRTVVRNRQFAPGCGLHS